MLTRSVLNKSLSLTSSLIAAFFLLTAINSHAQNSMNELSELPSGMYKSDLGHSSVLWKVQHLGLAGYVGRFIDFTADIDLDTGDISQSSLEAVIQTDSVITNYPKPELVDFDKKVAMEVLKGEEFPEIRFSSTEVSPLDGKNFSITGNLTLAGQTHPVTLEATLNGALLERPFTKKPVVGFSATTTFNRSDWGLGIYVPTVSDETQISIEGEFIMEDK